MPSYLAAAAAGLDSESDLLDVATPASAASSGAAPAVPSAAPAASSSAPIRLDATAMSAVVRGLAGGANPSRDAAAAPADGGTGSCGASGTGTSGRPGGRGAAIAALAAAVVACSCRREEERALAIAAGAPEGLLDLLLGCERPDTQVGLNRPHRNLEIVSEPSRATH